MVSNSFLPFTALPRGVSCANAAVANTQSAATTTKPLPLKGGGSERFAEARAGRGSTSVCQFMRNSSPRLRDDVDDGGLAFAHDGQRARDRGTQIGRVRNRAFAKHAHRLRQH